MSGLEGVPVPKSVPVVLGEPSSSLKGVENQLTQETGKQQPSKSLVDMLREMPAEKIEQLLSSSLPLPEYVKVVTTGFSNIIQFALLARQSVATLPNMLRTIADRLEGEPQQQQVPCQPQSQQSSNQQVSPRDALLGSIAKYAIDKVLEPIGKSAGKLTEEKGAGLIDGLLKKLERDNGD